MKKAIIIGATSGIGRALAVELARRGYAVGVTGRRETLLAELKAAITTPCYTKRMDLSLPEEAMAQLEALIEEMGGMDVLIISSGVGIANPDLEWPPERDTIAVNVAGFTAVATAGFRYFQRQDQGHLVGISSIAGLRGSRWVPAYSASKAYKSNYLEGLRARAFHQKLPIAVTDIRPGYVATPMTEHNQMMFWVAPVDAAARQIADAIAHKKDIAYITRRWSILAWVLKWIPGWLHKRG
ncbi:MAG: SDR family NAD(P)-dependent oxidoreductase [Armatimonadota bacterium]